MADPSARTVEVWALSGEAYGQVLRSFVLGVEAVELAAGLPWP